MVRIGAALFNCNHARLGEELADVAAAGVDFLHLDVFDGYFVPDLGFSPRTIRDLRPLTKLPFEVHLAARDPLRFLASLAQSGVNLVFLPVESCPLLYEAIFACREQGMGVGFCLALGTPLEAITGALPLVDTVLLLGRVIGEGTRGRDFNQLVLERTRVLRRAIDAGGCSVDLQVAGGLEVASCRAAVEAGATSLPLGGALFREADRAAFVARLRATVGGLKSAVNPEVAGNFAFGLTRAPSVPRRRSR